MCMYMGVCIYIYTYIYIYIYMYIYMYIYIFTYVYKCTSALGAVSTGLMVNPPQEMSRKTRLLYGMVHLWMYA